MAFGTKKPGPKSATPLTPAEENLVHYVLHAGLAAQGQLQNLKNRLSASGDKELKATVKAAQDCGAGKISFGDFQRIWRTNVGVKASLQATELFGVHAKRYLNGRD